MKAETSLPFSVKERALGTERSEIDRLSSSTPFGNKLFRIPETDVHRHGCAAAATTHFITQNG